jgi:hypothetical protein
MSRKRRMWLYFILAGVFLMIYMQSEAARQMETFYELCLLLAGACLAFAVNTLVRDKE